MHGGDVYRNKVLVDFSVNVNPLGVPEQVREQMENAIKTIQAYPDERCEALREKLAVRHGVGMETVLCGNGASELIHAICRWRRPKRALLLAPSFSGYQRALKAEDCRITHFYLRESDGFALSREMAVKLQDKLRAGAYDLFFLTNPANPTGALTDQETVLMLAKACEEAGTTMVADECFMELTDEPGRHSMVKELAEHGNLLVLRAFTKTFAIPGIRLGYLLCGEEAIAKKIAMQLPEWNVSIPAQEAGVIALEQDGYLKASRAFVKTQREWLAEGLSGLGAKTYHSDANFVLFRWTEGDLYEKLLEQGFLIRDCSDYEGLGKGYYRIAVRNRMENEALLQAIRR